MGDGNVPITGFLVTAFHRPMVLIASFMRLREFHMYSKIGRENIYYTLTLFERGRFEGRALSYVAMLLITVQLTSSVKSKYFRSKYYLTLVIDDV